MKIMNKEEFLCKTCNQVYPKAPYVPYVITTTVSKLEDSVPRLVDGVTFNFTVCVHCANNTKQEMTKIQNRKEKKDV